MALASYNDLKAAVADHLHRSDLTTPIVDLITLGEKRIQREVRTPDMETSYSGTIAAGVIAVPSDFLEWKLVYIDSSGVKKLTPKDLEWVFTNYPTRSADSTPKYIARAGSNFEFGPYPDTTYSVKGWYYKRLTTVASSWNALATANPDLYLFAALAEARAYVDDLEKVTAWDMKYQNARDYLNAEAKRQDISGGPLAATAR